MGDILHDFIAGLIVAVAIGYVLVRLWRSLRGGSPGPCGGCSTCDVANDCNDGGRKSHDVDFPPAPCGSTPDRMSRRVDKRHHRSHFGDVRGAERFIGQVIGHHQGLSIGGDGGGYWLSNHS